MGVGERVVGGGQLDELVMSHEQVCKWRFRITIWIWIWFRYYLALRVEVEVVVVDSMRERIFKEKKCEEDADRWKQVFFRVFKFRPMGPYSFFRSFLYFFTLNFQSTYNRSCYSLFIRLRLQFFFFLNIWMCLLLSKLDLNQNLTWVLVSLIGKNLEFFFFF